MAPTAAEISDARDQCPGAIVLFRVGDDYLADGVDAAWVSDTCDLPSERGHCRFPADQLERVLKQLVAVGQRVAICDQVADVPAGRELNRIVTPGTLADGDEDFTLEREPSTRPHKDKFDDAPAEQKKLFAGLDCLAGQGDIF